MSLMGFQATAALIMAVFVVIGIVGYLKEKKESDKEKDKE